MRQLLFDFQLNHFMNRPESVGFEFLHQCMLENNTFHKSRNTNVGLFENTIFRRLSLLTWAEYRVVATSQ